MRTVDNAWTREQLLASGTRAIRARSWRLLCYTPPRRTNVLYFRVCQGSRAGAYHCAVRAPLILSEILIGCPVKNKQNWVTKDSRGVQNSHIFRRAARVQRSREQAAKHTPCSKVAVKFPIAKHNLEQAADTAVRSGTHTRDQSRKVPCPVLPHSTPTASRSF